MNPHVLSEKFEQGTDNKGCMYSHFCVSKMAFYSTQGSIINAITT